MSDRLQLCYELDWAQFATRVLGRSMMARPEPEMLRCFEAGAKWLTIGARLLHCVPI